MKILKILTNKIDNIILIRDLDHKIKRLESTIENLIDRRGQEHETHVKIHASDIEKRENEIRHEFEIKLDKKDEMIKYLKSKSDENRYVYEILQEKKTQLEKLIFKIDQFLSLADNYQKESLSWMGATKGEIETFLKDFSKLENDILPKIERA